MATLSFNTCDFAYYADSQATQPSASWNAGGSWSSYNLYVGQNRCGNLISVSVSGTSDTISAITVSLPMATNNSGSYAITGYLYDTYSSSLKPTSNYSDIDSSYVQSSKVTKSLSSSTQIVTFTFSGLSITGKTQLYLKFSTTNSYKCQILTKSASSSASISCTTAAAYALYQPTSSSAFSGTCGFYTGGTNCTVSIKTSTQYPYIYAQDSPTGVFSYLGKATSGTYSATITADKTDSSTYKTKYFCASDTANISSLRPSTTYQRSLKVPRLCCKVYNGSSTIITIREDECHPPSDLFISPYTLLGFSTSATSKTVSYSVSGSPDGDGWYTDMDGKTLYAVHMESGSTGDTVTCTYYRGTTQSWTTTVTITVTDKYLYGKGSTTGGVSSATCSNLQTSCKADTSYSFQGFVTSTSAYNSGAFYANPGYAYIDTGKTTVYAVYLKAGGTETTSLCYYLGTDTPNYVDKTVVSGDSYYYGKGSHIDGGQTVSYGNVNTSCPVSGWTFRGFASSSSTKESTQTAKSLFDAGHTTIYGTYTKTESMTYHPENGRSSNAVSVTNYRYGIGSVTNNIPSEPSLTYDRHTFVNWATASGGTPLSWSEQWNNGVRTVYAIWEKDGNVYFGVVDGGTEQWVLCDTYYGAKVDGVLQWVPCEFKVGDGGWK